jgi:hypothetical protein
MTNPLFEEFAKLLADPEVRPKLVKLMADELKGKTKIGFSLGLGSNAKYTSYTPRTQQRICSEAELLHEWFLSQDLKTAQQFTLVVLGELQAIGWEHTSLCEDAALLLILPDDLARRLYERYVKTDAE